MRRGKNTKRDEYYNNQVGTINLIWLLLYIADE